MKSFRGLLFLIDKSRLRDLALLILATSGVLNAQDKPPRIEIGPVLSSGTSPYVGDIFKVGGGARLTVNATQYIAGEVELTEQPTVQQQPNGANIDETHTAIMVKGTYRAEQRRWLKFAGMNFFGVVGPAFLNHSVTIAAPQPVPYYCFACTVQQRQTAPMLEFGGGVEIVPTRHVSIRFDATHGSFNYTDFFGTENETRTYLKIALMLRLP